MTYKFESIIATIQSEVLNLKNAKSNILIAIDGRCASGKTTLSGMLSDILGADVVHIDDFYIPLNERDIDWKNTIGSNIDFSRIKSEVFENIVSKRPYIYNAYSCETGNFLEPIHRFPDKITIVEGSYSCHPDLINFYDLTVFMDVDADEQIRRIKTRNGESKSTVFESLWIPREEEYFRFFSVKDKCNLYYKT